MICNEELGLSISTYLHDTHIRSGQKSDLTKAATCWQAEGKDFVTKAQTPKETGILEGAARIELKHSLLGPRQEQTVIEKVQVDGPGGDFPFWTQVVEVQCCQLTTLHKSP